MLIKFSLIIVPKIYSKKFATISRKFLDNSVQQVTLKSKKQISHDTSIFTFKIPETTILGLPVGKHIIIYTNNTFQADKLGQWNTRKDNEIKLKQIQRKYTPITLDKDQPGIFSLIIKIYKKNKLFPDGGKMSQYLDSLKIGEQIKIKGPVGRHEYIAPGGFRNNEDAFKTFAMMAGGTGITPMFQIIRTILENPDDNTKIKLLYANKTEDDILLREELEKLQQMYPNDFSIWYTIDTPTENWKYSSGFITKEMIVDKLGISTDTAYLLCGPPPMIKYACQNNLKELSISNQQMITF